MCLLTVMSPYSTPTREQLMRAACANPHGFGYAIMFDDRIVTGRGLDAAEVIDRFLEIRERCPDTWAMFHHRYTTHGASTKSNCHPFRVGGDADIVLAHNGIIPIDIADGDKRSDTRVFAEDELPSLLEWLDDDEGFQALEDYVGWSKVAIFSLSPKLKNNVYIMNEDMGHWDRGIWWSNTSYKESAIERYNFRSYSYAWDDEEYEVIGSKSSCKMNTMTFWWKRSAEQECLYCSNALGDREWEYGYCEQCMSCLECANDIVDCDCERGDLLPDFSSVKSDYVPWWDAMEVVDGVTVG